MECKIIRANSRKHTHFAAATSQHANQSCKKSMLFTSPKKNFKIFFPTLKKIKPADTQDINADSRNIHHDNWTTEKEAHAHNKGLPKAGVTNFYDTFVLNRSLVFQINFSAETPRLRQAPNR